MTLPRPLTHEARVEFLRYTDPGRWPVLGRFPVGVGTADTVLAAMVAGDVDDVEAARSALVDERERAVSSLLSDATFVSALRQLPFGSGDRVVAVGDSITADRVGWFELMAAAIRRSPGPHAELVNLSLSGSTTADAIERFDLLEEASPSHVLMMLGTNDARGHGRAGRPTMVTAGETRRNLAALAELVTAELGSELVVLTPPWCDDVRTHAFFADLPLGWRAADVDVAADAVRALGAPLVDVHAFTRTRPVDALFDDDGVHLSRAGQCDVVRFVVRELRRDPGRGDRPSVRRDGATAAR